MSIRFGQPQLLKRAIERDNGQLDWLQLIKQAIAANRRECLRILKTFVGSEVFANIVTSTPNPPTSIKMQQEIGLTTQQKQSFLPQMAKEYPDFSKDTKDKFLFGELIEQGRVNIKEDILRHVRDPFCCLPLDKKVVKVEDLQLVDNFECPAERHGG